MDSVICLEQLTRRYGDLVAVDDLSLRVERGEIYALVGLNGAGKTTTIRMLLGLLRPSSGSARIFGQRAHARARQVWKRVGYMVETPHAYPELTVRQNLDVARRLRHLGDRRVVEDTIARLRLDPYADVRADRLSLGNRQRLGLGRALIHKPPLLILDEPTNGLDPAGVVEVRRMLVELAEQDAVTVLLSSHVLAEVARTATRIGVLHDGRLVEEIDAASLERHTHARLVVDARDRRRLADVLAGAGFAWSRQPHGCLEIDEERATRRPDDVARLLVGAGVAPTHLAVQTPDLETVFLDLVNSTTQADRPDVA